MADQSNTYLQPRCTTESDSQPQNFAKTCYKCFIEKPLTEFHKQTLNKDHLSNWCKPCAVARTNRYYKENQAARNIANRLWKKQHPFSRKETAWRRQGIACNKNLFEEMLRKQNNQCLICQQKPTIFVVDHCHKTGRVRGLLCSTCNRAIGLLKDAPELLSRALQHVS